MTVPGGFRRPGWIGAVLLVAAFTVACIAVLAPWQFDKARASELRGELIDRARYEAAVPLENVRFPDGGPDPSEEWRQVVVRGHYLPGWEVLLLHRSGLDGSATHVVTPFVTADSGEVVLVNRGALSGGDSAGDVDGGLPDAAAAPLLHDITLTAQLRAPESASRYQPPRVEGGTVTASAIDPAQLGEAMGLTLQPYYLQLASGQAGSLGELPPPITESGVPHFWYGVQWIAFGLFAPVALVALGVARVRSAGGHTDWGT